MMTVRRCMGALVIGVVVLASIGVAHAQLMPAPAPAPPQATDVPIRDLQLVATTPTRIAPGGTATFRVSFQLLGQGARQVETSVGWTVAGGAMQYGQFTALNAVPGVNSQNHNVTIPSTVTTSFDAQMVGAIRIDGKVYISQPPIVLSVVTAGPAPAPVQPAPQPTPAIAPPAPPGPPANPNITRVRAAIAERGVRVREVEYFPAQSGRPARLFATVDADYTQPSMGAIINLGSKVHAAMYQTFPLENQETLLGAAQIWQRYLIVVWARAADITTLLRANQAATTEAQRQQAWEAFLATLKWAVFSLDTGQPVDNKDFVNKNFTR